MTISPEHHEDGRHVGAPVQPTTVPTSLRPGDEHDWQPGETAADREARLRALGIEAAPPADDDLAARWAEQQAGGEQASEPRDA